MDSWASSVKLAVEEPRDQTFTVRSKQALCTGQRTTPTKTGSPPTAKVFVSLGLMANDMTSGCVSYLRHMHTCSGIALTKGMAFVDLNAFPALVPVP